MKHADLVKMNTCLERMGKLLQKAQNTLWVEMKNPENISIKRKVAKKRAKAKLSKKE